MRAELVFRLLGDSLTQVGAFLVRVGFTAAQPTWPSGPLPGPHAHDAARIQVAAIARWLEHGGCGVHRMEDELHAFCARAWLDLSTHALYHLDGHPDVGPDVLARDSRRINGFIAFWSTPHVLPGGLTVDYRRPRRLQPPPRQEGDSTMPTPSPATNGGEQPKIDTSGPIMTDELVDVLLHAGFTRADPPVTFTTEWVTVTIDHTRHITVTRHALAQTLWKARFSPSAPQVLLVSALRVAGITIP
ncbi:hypothetical protein [Frankia sp. CiP3]|uniref:hypothetical protein n=1 Tax=Frankia sp. CiP3 TaxID=2880971 RepID=UPI001EF70F54|nr:hypothetical protein [Frankia sp. CiP3]